MDAHFRMTCTRHMRERHLPAAAMPQLPHCLDARTSMLIAHRNGPADRASDVTETDGRKHSPACKQVSLPNLTIDPVLPAVICKALFGVFSLSRETYRRHGRLLHGSVEQSGLRGGGSREAADPAAVAPRSTGALASPTADQVVTNTVSGHDVPL